MDQQMLCDLKGTVNPLVYVLHLSWCTTIPPKQQLLLWNLLQQWMALNDVVPYGKVQLEQKKLVTQAVIKRRFGAPKEEVPW